VRPVEIDQLMLGEGDHVHHLAAEPEYSSMGSEFRGEVLLPDQRAALQCNAQLLEDCGRRLFRHTCIAIFAVDMIVPPAGLKRPICA